MERRRARRCGTPERIERYATDGHLRALSVRAFTRLATTARLGESTQFTADIFDGSRPSLFLGIKVGSDPEMSPRQQITSVPFAL